MHDEAICDRCGGKNPIWVAPSPLWNEVIRGGDINGSEIYQFICPNCFIILAEEKHIAQGWRLYATDIFVELQTITPTGRVWNDKTWLFD